jgi:hypothetical protein
MTCAELFRLQYPVGVRRADARFHTLGTVADHDVQAVRPESHCRIYHVLEEGFACQWMQDLWQRGFHPRALTGSEDHNVESHERLDLPGASVSG